MSNGTQNGEVTSYCPRCKRATFHVITKRGPLCKECLAKNSLGYIGDGMSTESAVKLCEICKEVPATKGSVYCAPCRAADYERSNTLNLARSYATELDADKKSESAVKHTPEWRAGTMQSTGEISVMKDWDWTGKAICRGVDTMEHARLIASAPALLEASEAVSEAFYRESLVEHRGNVMPKVWAAIRQAKGE